LFFEQRWLFFEMQLTQWNQLFSKTAFLLSCTWFFTNFVFQNTNAFGKRHQLIFSIFSCIFLNPNAFFQFESLLDIRNLQEQVKKTFCYQKLFWPFHCLNKLFLWSQKKLFSITRTIFSHSKTILATKYHFFQSKPNLAWLATLGGTNIFVWRFGK
jgi:hypothetical protein